MKCQNCGNQLPDNSLFCDNCGQKLENINKAENVFCGNCGAKIEYGEQFCGECGAALSGVQSDKTVSTKSIKKRRWTGIVVALLITCVAAVAVVIGYIIYSRDDSSVNDNTSAKMTATANPEQQAQATPSASPSNSAMPETTSIFNTEAPVSNAPDSVISDRADLYNSALTYKRMSDIHNTVLVDDKTFNSLKAIIEEFDRQCANYMNETTDAVPSLLKIGTTAYSQQVEYKKKHPTLNQSYQKVDVINARQGGGYYYVWVTEVLNVNENSTAKVTTDHWVYKIENDHGNWYICDYTYDPAF